MKYNSLSFKIIIGFFIVTSIYILTTVYISSKLSNINKDTRLINKGYLPFLKYLSKIETNINNDKYIIINLINENEYKNSYRKIINARYKKHPVNKTFKELLNYLENAKHEFRFLKSKKFFTFAKNQLIVVKHYYDDFMKDCSNSLNNKSLLNKCKSSSNKLSSRVNYLLKTTEKKLASLSRKTENNIKITKIYHIIFALVLIFLIIIIASLILFSLNPIKKLIHVISNIKNGNYSKHIKIKSKNEIGILANSLNNLMDSLKDKENKINEQNAILKKHHEKEIEIKNKLLDNKNSLAIGKLSSQIVHEIRNPLNSIALNIDIIEDEILSQDYSINEIKPIFKSIKTEVTRLEEITQNYLQLSKKPQLNKKTTDIKIIIQDIINFMFPELEKNNIVLNFLYDKNEHYFIEIDSNKIKQVIINIIKNSIHAISEKGSITINLDKIENDFLIKIEDTGIGIVEKEIKNIFTPFFTTKKYGTGLGLFLVKEIIEEHEGKIIFNSKFGKGTTINIYLPYGDNQE